MSNSIKVAEPRRLYQQVADQIRDLIQAGKLSPGARLPAERELAQQLGVSRPSLREALIALEIEGSVEIRMGSGIYVTADPVRRHWQSGQFSGPQADLQRDFMGESPQELMQARAAVEGAVILLAAARSDPDMLKTLRRVLDRMQVEIGEGRKPLDLDRQFHMTIAEQSGNSVLARMVGDLYDERHSPMSAQIRVHFETPETWGAALAEHEAIYAALEAGNPLLAQAMMHAHLEESKQRWMNHETR